MSALKVFLPLYTLYKYDKITFMPSHTLSSYGSINLRSMEVV